MPTFDALQEHFQSLIRKGLQGSVFVKKWADGDPEITALQDGSGLLALPSGYEDVGYLTKDQGAQWTRAVDSNDTQSLGASEPTRRDLISDVTGLQFTPQESKRTVFELYEGQDLSGVQYDATGNLSWDKPDRPALQYYRTFVLFKDGDGADAVYFAKWGPKMQVTDRGDQAWNEQSEVQSPITMSAFVDEAVGTSMRSLWAGPTSLLTDMGFTAAP